RTVGTALDLLHDLVAVERPLREQQQCGGADVATAGPRPACEAARPAGEWAPSASPAPQTPALPPASGHFDHPAGRQEAEPATRQMGAGTRRIQSDTRHPERVTRYIAIDRP